jgi:hypothetical protein
MNAHIHNYWLHRYQHAKTPEDKQRVAMAYFDGDASGINTYLMEVETNGGTTESHNERTLPA